MSDLAILPLPSSLAQPRPVGTIQVCIVLRCDSAGWNRIALWRSMGERQTTMLSLVLGRYNLSLTLFRVAVLVSFEQRKYRSQDLLKTGFRFSMDDFLIDKVLYLAFLDHLDELRSSENLRCLQAIALYKQLVNGCFLDQSLRKQAVEQSWTIYKFFVAEDSAYEVSVNDAVSIDIRRDLANPNYGTFDKIDLNCRTALREHLQVRI